MIDHEARIKELEEQGMLDPNCRTCQEQFYPRIRKGARLVDIFAPQHKARDWCRSGKHPHCTCDSCF